MRIITSILILVLLISYTSAQLGYSDPNKPNLVAPSSATSNIIISNGTGTFNLTDYCYANGTNSSGVDCIRNLWKINQSLTDYSGTKTIRNESTLRTLYDRLSYIDFATGKLRFWFWDTTSGEESAAWTQWGDIYTNNSGALLIGDDSYPIYSGSKRFCLSDGTGCQSTGSAFNSTYNNLIGQTCQSGQVMNGTYTNGSIKCQTVTATATMDYTNIAMTNLSNNFTQTNTIKQLIVNDYDADGFDYAIKGTGKTGLLELISTSENGYIKLTNSDPASAYIGVRSGGSGFLQSAGIFRIETGGGGLGWANIGGLRINGEGYPTGGYYFGVEGNSEFNGYITILGNRITNGTASFTLQELNATGSSSGNASWNESYADTLFASIVFGYNMTTPFTNWLSTFTYNYNETQASINYLNSTYGHTWKNWTSEANATLYNQYGKYWYNMTVSASSTPNDGITIKYENITNIPSCSSGQFLTNSSGSLSCATPSSSPILTVYKSDNMSTNVTGTTFATLYTIPLVAQTNYTISCRILRSSNATTSGVRYNMSLANAPDWMVVNVDSFTTATTDRTNGVASASKSLMPPAIPDGLTYPSFLDDEVEIFIDGNANTGGNAVFQFSGESANLLAVAMRGSYCRVDVIQ